MLKQTLIALYRRDLEKLKQEIEAYKTEENLWRVENEAPNSAGNLTLHLIGNLNGFIGAVIGESGYVRDRDSEFSDVGIPRSELLKMVDDTVAAVESAVNAMTDDQFSAEYPLLVYKDKLPTGSFLIYLASHLSYHLGQINYHRRLLDQ